MLNSYDRMTGKSPPDGGGTTTAGETPMIDDEVTPTDEPML